MKVVKVREHGEWTSCTYMTRTKKPFAIALSGKERVEAERRWV
jgi:hypothetical protein